MSATRWIAIGVGVAAAVAFEAAFPPSLRIAGNGPDLLLAVAACAAARAEGSLVAAALLGTLRDATAGGVPGRFAVGYLLAALILRAAFGRVRERGLGLAVTVTFLGGLVGHLVGGLVPGVLGRAPLGTVPRDALVVAALSACFAAAVAVPVAALETLLGEDARPKPNLAAHR